MSNFVTLTKEQFEEQLPELMDFSIVDVPNCKEIVYDIPSPVPEVDVRIYSTIDIRTMTTRRIGSDAIRVVFWDKVNDRPIGKGKKILRVEGATSIGDRLNARIVEFFEEAHNQEVVDFDYVKAVLSHDSIAWMDFAGSLLEQVEARGSLTDKQLAWVLGEKNPKGRKTMEAKVLAADPYFKDELVNGIAEEDNVAQTPQPEVVRICKWSGCHYYSPEATTYCCDDCSSTAYQLEEELSPVEPMTENFDLIPTKKYKPHKYSFKEFNPVQSGVLPYASKNCNMVIGANTSAGKTICAEFLMDAALAKGERVIYLSPLKALTQEKFDDWKVRFKDYNITILTGDYTLSEKRKAELAEANIIVMTSEMCDSRTRRMKSENNFWLKQVGLVVVDESHILTTTRGHAVEAGIMRFTSINKKSRVLFLSATMPNCDELASWLTLLNGKQTEVVYSTWRPVVLDMNYIGYNPATYENSGQEDYWGTQAIKLNKAVSIAMSKPDEKFLIFVHDKGTGRRVVKALEKNGESAHFHNADLDLEQRLEVEQKFADRDNGIRVLVSTSTLAWGRNLPARNVIVVGIHRGINEVDELDIIQMCGRAGRYGIDDKGFVFILLPVHSQHEWIAKFENPRPVKSVLDEYLHFHAIAEIETKTIQDSTTLVEWYSRSLASFQKPAPMTIEKGNEILQKYSEMEMIEGDGIRISPTGLGRVCAWLYFHPSDVYKWFQNFDKVFTIENQNVDEELLLAWAIGDIPANDMGYIPKPIEMDANNYSSALAHDYGIRPTAAIIASMALHHAITGNDQVPEALKSLKRQLVWDIERINQALTLIDSQYAYWQKKTLWAVLPQRVKYGVPAEVAQLTRLNQVGGKRAVKLYEKGFTTIEEIAKAKIKELCKVFTPAMAKKVKATAKKMISS